jgi:thiol-disulfide isomerase/thioredoxin
LALTDARTGQAFTLADFAGKTVFVEPMATWCSNCRQQLNNLRAAREQLAGDDVIFVALSVETNISSADLARYADEQGFDWIFAVATPELLEGLVGEFGRSITNPPATPHFLIKPDGSVSELKTGIEPADAIVQQVGEAQKAMQ